MADSKGTGTGVALPTAPGDLYWLIEDGERPDDYYGRQEVVYVKLMQDTQVKKLFGRGMRTKRTCVGYERLEGSDLAKMTPADRRTAVFSAAVRVLDRRQTAIEYAQFKAQGLGEYR